MNVLKCEKIFDNYDETSIHEWGEKTYSIMHFQGKSRGKRLGTEIAFKVCDKKKFSWLLILTEC